MTTPSVDAIERLICAKYLFQHGIHTLDRKGPYAGGIAILSFHDATELVLRVIAEHVHAQIKENALFHELIKAIEEGGNQKIAYRSALNQLNKARTNFKHLALFPRYEDAWQFRQDLEGFFPSVLSTFLKVDYHELSLAKRIRHRRVSNWLVRAESHLAQDELTESVHASAVAMEIFLRHRRSSHTHAASVEQRAMSSLGRSVRFKDDDVASVSRLAQQAAAETDKELKLIWERLELMSSGIDLLDYKRFKDMTPAIYLTAANTIHAVYHRQKHVTSEDALFCCAFAVRTALKLQEEYRPDRWDSSRYTRRFEVIKSGPIVVWPAEKEDEAEVIMTVEPGQQLIGYFDSYDKQNYTAVLQDDDCAFISKECVRLISPELSGARSS